jgi:hypothetical protein
MSASVNPTSKPTRGLSAVANPKTASSSDSITKGVAVKKKAPAQTQNTKTNGATVSDQQRRNYIEVAAYFIAEHRGFNGGSELEDWEQAEHEVDRLLRESRLSS